MKLPGVELIDRDLTAGELVRAHDRSRTGQWIGAADPDRAACGRLHYRRRGYLPVGTDATAVSNLLTIFSVSFWLGNGVVQHHKRDGSYGLASTPHAR